MTKAAWTSQIDGEQATVSLFSLYILYIYIYLIFSRVG